MKRSDPVNHAALFRAALRVPYMQTRRYHDAELQHLATLGERLADEYDRLVVERGDMRAELHRIATATRPDSRVPRSTTFDMYGIL